MGQRNPIAEVIEQRYWIRPTQQCKTEVKFDPDMREAIRDDIDLCIDFRGRVAKPMAKQLLAEFKSIRSMFIEEPLLPEHSNQLLTLERHSTVPIATGERLYR